MHRALLLTVFALLFAAPASVRAQQEPAPGVAATPPAAPTAPAEPDPAVAVPRPISAPADPASAAAYAVLEKYCARCHQGGRLDRAEPAAAFGNVLRLDELASLPHLVQPGNPDASRLYVMMLRRQMPLDTHADATPSATPTPEELNTVRTWIARLEPRPACRDRRVVQPSDHAAALAAVAAATGEDPSKLRFLSIAHLHNGCARFDALAAYRQAVIRLINSLSWKPTPIAVPPVDVGRTLFKINLDDLGWLPEHWERIMRSGSDPLGLVPPLPADVRKPFGTDVPIARADWFAATVLTAPLYYEVLGLPGTGPEIRKILQVGDLPAPVLRAGIKPSAFSVQPSLIERQRARTGAFWMAYSQFAQDSSSDLSALADAAASAPVPHHASRILFQLPNGLPAFAIAGQRGDRLDAMPPEIARPAAQLHGEVRSGLDCMACHATGPAARHAAALPKTVDDAMAADRSNVSDALRRIGIDPSTTLDGVEPVVALAGEYSRPVDGVRAAAELGRPLDELVQAGQPGDTGTAVLARRLVLGLVARTEVEQRAAELTALLSRPAATPETPVVKEQPAAPVRADASAEKPIDTGPGIVLYSDKPRYRKGDLLHLVVKVTGDCHLTVISIDQRGRGTVIFPSDFETNAHLVAGQELKLPGNNAPYAFRLSEAGRETVVAACNDASAGPEGIKHDFERQRFTDLGNYASYLVQAMASNGTQPAAEAAHDRSASGKRAVERSRARLPRRGRTDTPEAPAGPDQTSRTAITIVVD